MLDITYIIRTLGIVSILAAIIQDNCYAILKTTAEEISVKCSSSQEEVKPQVYAGAPNVYLGLTTKGIRVAGEEELLIPKHWNWDYNDALVIARCTVSDSVTNAKEMFPYLGRNLNILPTLECRRGEGIEIVMYKPNDQDPNKYQYIANLTIDRLVHKKKPKETVNHRD